MITVNGQIISVELPMTVAQYLEKNQYVLTRVAVELNQQIVSKAKYGETQLNDNDVLEVVSFVGGG